MRILLLLVALLGCQKHPQGHPVIDDFRDGERAILLTFNGLLGQQRANAIDETGLADAIDKDVLPPWREVRARVDATQPTAPAEDRELYVTLRRYLAERQTAWEAYSAALRSPNDVAAKPHYATYHEQNAAADADARALGEMFRRPGF